MKFACALLAAFLLSCNRQKPTLEQTPTPVRLSAVEMYTPERGERYSASILPNRQVNLAFKVNGFVDSIYHVRGAGGGLRSIDIGDVVKQGTVLAQVRTKDYELQVSQAEGQLQQARQSEQTARAQLQQAEASALDAQQNFDRADALFNEKSLTKSDYDSAKANRDTTRAQVEAARSQVQASAGAVKTSQAALGTASLSVNDTSLLAPFTAVIVQRSVEIGTLAGPSIVAFVIADISLVKATFAVSDITVARLRKGSALSIYAEAFPTRQFRGIVSTVAAVADSSTRSFQVEVTIPNEDAVLRPGMIASLNVEGKPVTQPVAVAPLNAIVRESDESSKFAVVVVDNGVARRRPVCLGATYGNLIAVSGVAPGERIVTSGASFLNNGDSVKVVP
ncbi:MAG: efflux RND transporter periplasmic adaptor subunit [Acidobacteriaceae bacterium]|nr:efflux RND transporter periplasmic adaptor subunit [Acidobacteriaceae bacterium]